MPETILIIDDEPKNIKLLERFLSDAPYSVLTANDGAEGLDILQNSGHSIDVILLDRMMPNMDGMEFIKKMKDCPAHKDIPIVMQTAAGESKQVAEGIAAGVYYYLTKPFDEELLLSIVNAALRDSDEQQTLRGEISKQQHVMGLINKADFCIRTLEEGYDLAIFMRIAS